MARRDDRVAQKIHFIARFAEPRGDRVADRQHADQLGALDDRQMANVMLVHQLLRGGHALRRLAGDDLARHQVAHAPLAKTRGVLGERPHQIASGDNANQRIAGAANGHGADVVGGQSRRDRLDGVLRRASDGLLAVRSEKIADSHKLSPYSFVAFGGPISALCPGGGAVRFGCEIRLGKTSLLLTIKAGRAASALDDRPGDCRMAVA